MKVQWKLLNDLKGLEQLTQLSFEKPCLIFKHSTRCEISRLAKNRLERDWQANFSEIEPFFLDILAFRTVSNEIESSFEVKHESPQILLVSEGVCVYHESHVCISYQDLINQLKQQNN